MNVGAVLSAISAVNKQWVAALLGHPSQGQHMSINHVLFLNQDCVRWTSIWRSEVRRAVPLVAAVPLGPWSRCVGPGWDQHDLRAVQHHQSRLQQRAGRHPESWFLSRACPAVLSAWLDPQVPNALLPLIYCSSLGIWRDSFHMFSHWVQTWLGSFLTLCNGHL